MPGTSVEPYDEEKQVDTALELSRQIRSVAPDCDLMIDCGGIFSLQAAHRLIRNLREVGMLFVEEPVNPDRPQDYATLRRSFGDIRIAAGERLMTRWGLLEWLESGAVDVVQADISHTGGIGELMRMAAMAEVYNVSMAPHNPYGPVALAANVHAAAAMQNFIILEHCRHRPWFDKVQKQGLAIKDGYVELPTRPGLGVELDWDYIAANPY